MSLVINYDPFWKTLKEKGITQYQMIHEHSFSAGTLNALRRNKSITMNTLREICTILECDIADVVVLEDNGDEA